MSTVSVRAIRGEDRPGLERLLSLTTEFRKEEVACAMELVDEALEHGNSDRDYTVVCAESAGAGIVGFLCYGQTPLTRSTYDLYWIAISPAQRRRGVARSLLRHLECALREKGAAILIAETSSTPPYAQARSLYAKEGFRQEARIRDFYAPGDDKLIYCKRFTGLGSSS
jgi:ribosomal protein S18 acetylase RimI-like enzyme